MTCFNPKYAKYSYGKGKNQEIAKNITFIKKDTYKQHKETLDQMDPLQKLQHGLTIIPCGKCIGCRLDKAKEWGLRGLLEAKRWKNNCFITLTYNNKHLPKDKNLHKEDFQNFLKRLRKNYSGIEPRIWHDRKTKQEIIEYPIRYFYSGEYGPEKLRVHAHIGIFNWKPTDLKFFKFNDQGNPMYRSEQVERLWSIKGLDGKYHQIGFVTVEDMNFYTAQYIGRYTAKKCFGLDDEKIKSRGLKPEFIECSRNGGLAYHVLENKNEWEKMKRNYGFFSKDKKGNLKLMKIPQFLKNKWKDKDILEYYEHTDKHSKEAEKNINNILEQTNYTIDEYLKIQKRTLIEKLKSRKSLRRNRIKTATTCL